VSFRRDRPERTAPQNILAIISPQQIGKVRVPAGKLFDRDAPFNPFDFSLKPLSKKSDIQFFA
jgi:hypothetical protein